jgi:putative DNA primase/helicase
MPQLKLRKIAGGAMRGDCPACGYPDAFTVRTGDNGKPLYWCASCRDQDAIMLAMRGYEPQPLPECRATKDTFDKQAAALAIWKRGRPAPGTLVESYLRGRGYRGKIPPTLRWNDRSRHLPSGKWYPMMVGAVTVWPSVQPVAVHRTYLDRDTCGKAPVDPVKKTLGPIFGGSVRLAPAGEVMVVGEGIETCLSVQETTGLPAWAALSAGNIPRIVLPEIVRHVFIAADNDDVGIAAANQAAEIWRAGGRQVTIALPALIGSDFNDCLAGD